MRVTSDEPPEQMRGRVRDSFARQAMMRTLGVEIAVIELGRVELTLPFDVNFTQQDGFLHAGAVASVLDSACGYAAFSVMRPEAAVLTVAYTINLLSPAHGDRFWISGQVVRAGRTLVVARREAFAEGVDEAFAVMQSTLAVVYGREGVEH